MMRSFTWNRFPIKICDLFPAYSTHSPGNLP